MTYFLTSITMRDPQTSDMRQIRQMMSALHLASVRLSKLWILFLNNLLDGSLCKNFFISIFYLFFLVFKHDFIGCVDLPILQLQTQQVMTSQIMSHIEYLIQTYYILVLIF